MLSTPNRTPGTATGFTIVELLIVIVVIAILAAISIASYNGIQQRANNTATIDAASKSLRMMQAYIAANDAYPFATNGDACITIDSGCIDSAGVVKDSSTTFNTNIATVGVVPLSIPKTGSANGAGMWFTYNTTMTYGGTTQPMRLTYHLLGTNQNCGVGNVVQYTWPNFIASTTGYSLGNISSLGKTLCWVTVPGPSS